LLAPLKSLGLTPRLFCASAESSPVPLAQLAWVF